jgi:DNA-binding MarR family transcriptional regulator
MAQRAVARRSSTRSTARARPADHERVSAEDVAQLARAVYRDATAIAAAIAATSGMHPTDVTAMRALDLAGGNRPTMGELGAALGLSSPAVTGLVDRLEHHGLARRVPDPADRRRVRVELTDRAREVGGAVLAPVAARIQAATAALDADERAVVARFLRGVVDPSREPGP